MNVICGDVIYADLGPVVGSEQDGIRPVVVLQNDIGNKYSPTIIIAPMTTKKKAKLPTHIYIPRNYSNLLKDSTVLVEQLRTIDKLRIIKKVGHLPSFYIEKIKKAIKVNFSIRGEIADLYILLKGKNEL